MLFRSDRVIVVARPGNRRVARAVGIARTEWDSEADAIEAAEAAGKALADSVVGGTVEQTSNRMRLFGVDGTLIDFRHGNGSIGFDIEHPGESGGDGASLPAEVDARYIVEIA